MAGLASALGSIDWMNPEGTKVRHNPEAFLKGAAEWQEKERTNCFERWRVRQPCQTGSR